MELKKATISDLEELQDVCSKAYSEAFAHHWIEDGMSLYLAEQFGAERLERELLSQSFAYYFIRIEEKNIGFAKMKYESSQQFSKMNNCELEKIYILPSYSRKGIGKFVMTTLIEIAQQKGKEELFLCVIDTNEAAIAFYKKLGFIAHSKLRLTAPKFREALRGMIRMELKLSER